MSTGIIRQKLHSYLEIADDKKVKAIYAIIEDDIERSATVYTNEIRKNLDERYADYKNGKAKMITPQESVKQLQKILKRTRKP